MVAIRGGYPMARGWHHTFSFFFFFLSSQHYHPACGHKGSSHLSPGSRLTIFLSRCKFSTLTTRQPMVEFYLLTFPRFPLRKKQHKSYFGKNRTHDFCTSRCAAYLLDHSGQLSLSSCCCCCCFSHSAYWLPTRKNYFTRWPIPLVVC